jgi:hypothetical protein
MPGIKIKGPQRFLRKDKRFVNYATRSGIIMASLTYNDANHDLLSNQLSIHIRPESSGHHVFLYHSYDYLENGVHKSGRWYNLQFPIESLHALNENNIMLRVNMEYYENDDEDTYTATAGTPAEVRIVFTPTGINKLRKHLHATNTII